MKKVALALVMVLIGISAQAQILKPAKWTYSVSKNEVKAGETVELIFQAAIDQNWYLYSTDFDPNLGPMITTFTFKPHASYQLVGTIKPVKPKKKYDDLWGGEYTYFTGNAQFRQTVKILNAGTPPKIEGSIDYQVCSEVDGKCIPNTEEFSFANIKVAGINNAIPSQSGSGVTAVTSADSSETGALLNESAQKSKLIIKWLMKKE